MTKQRLVEILITSLISAGIAFLQSILANWGHDQALSINPLTTGIIGASIHIARLNPIV